MKTGAVICEEESPFFYGTISFFHSLTFSLFCWRCAQRYYSRMTPMTCCCYCCCCCSTAFLTVFLKSDYALKLYFNLIQEDLKCNLEQIYSCIWFDNKKFLIDSKKKTEPPCLFSPVHERFDLCCSRNLPGKDFWHTGG